jgi:hypothetical protein
MDMDRDRDTWTWTWADPDVTNIETMTHNLCLTLYIIRHFVIRRFVPFNIISIRHFVPFAVISIRHFVPFDIMSHSAFITFDIMSLRRFVPFDILSVRHFVSFDIFSFGNVSHSTFCRSTFFPFGVCYFNILSVNQMKACSNGVKTYCSKDGFKRDSELFAVKECSHK